MRVDDRHLAGSQAAQSGKTSQAQEAARDAQSRPVEGGSAAGADRVVLSALTGGVARALETDGRERASRLERLAADYAEGRYQVDFRAVSRAILAEVRATAGQADVP